MRPSHCFVPKRVLLFALGLSLGIAALAGSAAAQSPQKTASPDVSKASTGASSPAAPASPASRSANASPVHLPVVVRDKKGALVQNLTKDDLSLQVDGHPEVIRSFDRDPNLPLTLGLLVDTSPSQRKAIDDERTASASFFDQMLTADKDKAFLIQFSHSVELLQDVTSSRSKLQAALKEIETPPPADGSWVSAPNSGSNGNGNGNDGDSGNASGNHGRSRSGSTLYDALFLASDELLSRQKGRKVVILLSDGVDRGSKESLAMAIETAQRADTIVYAIYFKGETAQDNTLNRPMGRNGGGGYPGGGYPGGGYPGGGYPGGGYPRGGGGSQPNPVSHVDGRKVLERIAHETGGRLFEVSKHETTAQIYTEIAEELRAQYQLGYTPDEAASGDGYHKIDLAFAKPEDKKLALQTREGYYGGKIDK
jgi:VWFA-related protein